MEEGSVEKSTPASFTEVELKFRRPLSPEYSQSLLKLLGTDNSLWRVLAFFTRKLVDRGEEIGKAGPISKQNILMRQSECDPITVTLAINLSHDIAGTSPPAVPVEIFLGPSSETVRQAEIEHSRSTTKRPRVGSCSNSDNQSPPKFGLLFSYLTHRQPCELSLGHKGQDPTSVRAKTCSRSELGLETVAETVTNPAGSTIAQVMNSSSREFHHDVSDTISTFAPIRFQGKSRYSTLRPSGPALMKGYFSSIDAYILLKGHPFKSFH